MRRGGLLVVIAICALPAQGDNLATGLTLAERHALTPIDTVVTPEALDNVLQAPDLSQRIARLAEIGVSTEDLGVRLRAIRALPRYCSASCQSDGISTGDPAHLAVRQVLRSIDVTDHGGGAILRLRATLEALGATRSGLAEDVTLIVPFLDHASRDIRVTAARALGDLGSLSGLCDSVRNALKARLMGEPLEQVRSAIFAALRVVGSCVQ